MKQFLKFLQEPWLRLFLSPLGYFLFGVITASVQSQHFEWKSFILLVIYTIASHLLEHYFFVKYNEGQEAATPPAIWYGLEAILALTLIASIFINHWLVTLLLLGRALFVHSLYFPYNLSTGTYRLFYQAFFDGLILNAVGYFTQMGALDFKTLGSFMPMTLIVLALALEELRQRQSRAQIDLPSAWLNRPQVTYALIGGALILGVYYSLPSQSYWLLQVLFLAGGVLLTLPLTVQTQESHQAQNKINYLHAMTFIISVLYSLSYLW